MSRRTPLYDLHLELGASLVEYAGWMMPVRYTSDIVEHIAVRKAAGLFDLSHMGEIEVSGREAADALDYALVGALSQLAVGRARYTMICDGDGGVLDDLVVYRLGQLHFLVVSNASNSSGVLEQLLGRSSRFDVTVRDASEEWALIAVQGPASGAILARVTQQQIDGLKYYGIVPAQIAGSPVYLARTGYTGEDGFEVYCHPQLAANIWTTLLAEGHQSGLTLAGLSCRDSLRLEAGMPLYGHELTQAVTPYEAGLGRIVALDKPNFVGRSALLDRERTGPRKALVGIACEARRAPRAGYPLYKPGTNEQVGLVTSGAPSPTLGIGIAMAYVTPKLSAFGTQLEVAIRGAREDAAVVQMPFYKRTHRPITSATTS
jgi:aminomethyltransferase